MARRTLALQREPLTELSPAELDAVVGADLLAVIPTNVMQAPNCLTLAGPGCIT
jgi:hypothetical protein